MCRLARAFAVLAFVIAGAATLPAGEAHVSLVPWKVLDPQDVVDAPLSLFWVPAAREELRRSPLLTSSALALFATRCVAMRVVRLDDRMRIAKLELAERIPTVVLTDGEGRVLGRVDAEDGVLPLADVEDLVREAIDEREANADALIDRARRLAEQKETRAARELYERVWGERCVCPRQGRDARRALRKLGTK